MEFVMLIYKQDSANVTMVQCNELLEFLIPGNLNTVYLVIFWGEGGN